MATINNGDVIRNLIEQAKIQTSIDKVPTQLAEKIVPTLPIYNIYPIKIVAGLLSDSTGGALMTTSTTKKTFIVGATISTSKDVNSTAVSSYINCTPKGMTSNLNFCYLRFEPITAASGLTQTVMLPIPLELQPNTAIAINNSHAVASIDSYGIVYYYEVD